MARWNRMCVLAGLFCSLAGDRRLAADEKATCLKAYEDTQLARRDKHLATARVAAQRCSALSCPQTMRPDCIDWLNQLESEMPSIVVGLTINGKEATEAEVTIDTELVTAKIDGSEIQVDPGSHTLQVRAPGFPPQQQQFVMRIGGPSVWRSGLNPNRRNRGLSRQPTFAAQFQPSPTGFWARRSWGLLASPRLVRVADPNRRVWRHSTIAGPFAVKMTQATSTV